MLLLETKWATSRRQRLGNTHGAAGRGVRTIAVRAQQHVHVPDLRSSAMAKKDAAAAALALGDRMRPFSTQTHFARDLTDGRSNSRSRLEGGLRSRWEAWCVAAADVTPVTLTVPVNASSADDGRGTCTNCGASIVCSGTNTTRVCEQHGRHVFVALCLCV